MSYYIFLKSLGSLEEFRKNPHIKIPPKSPCIDFQSLGIFKNLIFIPKRIFLQIPAQSAQPPTGLFGPCGPTRSPLPPSLMSVERRLPLARHRTMATAPPSSHAMERPQWPGGGASITLPPLQSVVIPPSLPVTAAMKVPITAAARHSWPSLPPDPIKGAVTLRWSTSPLHLASSPHQSHPRHSCLEPKPRRRCTTSSPSSEPR
jgi:hypothetical protein